MDFQRDVLDQSKTTPVLVDFWAPWCGPCQFLGPILEEMATEAQGKWKLVKVNTDENQELAMRHGVRGIPDVKLFYKGEPVGQFTGALPKYQIEKWLEEHIPDPRKEALKKLEHAVFRDHESNILLLEQFVRENPEMKEAKLALARAWVYRHPEKAQELLKDIRLEGNVVEEVEDLHHILNLMNRPSENGGKENALANDARDKAMTGDLDGAMETLIKLVVQNKDFEEGLARKACIGFFRLLGPGHPVTQKHRKAFDMALY